MKNSIILLSLLIGVKVKAQTDKFRAVEYVISKDHGKEIKPSLHEKVNNYPIFLNRDSGTFLIKGPKEEFFTIKYDPSGRSETDSTATFRFTAVDREGVDCYVVAVFAKVESAIHDGFFIIAYQDKCYLYYVERG